MSDILEKWKDVDNAAIKDTLIVGEKNVKATI